MHCVATCCLIDRAARAVGLLALLAAPDCLGRQAFPPSCGLVVALCSSVLHAIRRRVPAPMAGAAAEQSPIVWGPARLARGSTRELNSGGCSDQRVPV